MVMGGRAAGEVDDGLGQQLCEAVQRSLLCIVCLRLVTPPCATQLFAPAKVVRLVHALAHAKLLGGVRPQRPQLGQDPNGLSHRIAREERLRGNGTVYVFQLGCGSKALDPCRDEWQSLLVGTDWSGPHNEVVSGTRGADTPPDAERRVGYGVCSAACGSRRAAGVRRKSLRPPADLPRVRVEVQAVLAAAGDYHGSPDSSQAKALIEAACGET
jgi:hypothetical protein